MKSFHFTKPIATALGLFLLCGCAIFEAKKPTTTPMVPPKPLTFPVGKNWQVIEEAPNLSDERGRVPFQTEQSILPAGVSPVVPTENRKIETPR
jgi:hypothetical protein